MDANIPTETDVIAEACRSVFGIPYPFPWQRLIIASILDALQPPPNGEPPAEPLRRIAVLPTGAGKSLCWMLPAAMAGGLTVAVFPLLSLIADQERRLSDAGIPSVTLKGGLESSARRRAWERLENGDAKIILANPEILGVESVARRLGALAPRFLVVDETHTVSQWGESFRPACAGLGRLVDAWNPAAVLALTATAGPFLRERITALLFNGRPPAEALADPDRPAIRYGVLPSLSRIHALERLIREERRPAVVFGITRSSVETAARILRRRLNDENIRYYHAGLSPAEKRRLEAWFLESRDGVLCATCAYGLGIDKSDIRTVVHLAPPGSVEAYLQESGRASRDGKGANAWLIRTPEDAAIPADSDDPESGPREAPGDGRSSPPVPEGDPGDPAGTVADSESPAIPRPVEKAVPAPRAFPEAVVRSRRAAMARYAASTDRCRREMLLEALDIEARDCTGCDVCGGEAWPAPPEEEAILRAVRRNRGRFRRGQLARILIGRRNVEIRRLGLDSTRGFGSLAGWQLEDAEEAIGVLIRVGKLGYGRLRSTRKISPMRATRRTCVSRRILSRP